MYDLVIRNGTVVDGTGLPSYRADVAVSGDRIVAIGRIAEKGKEEIDASGQVVTPGFIDGHTHMDAQVFWDPIGSCSCWHGVTTAVMGNCGFTLAPGAPEQRDLIVSNIARAEDISADAMAAAIQWEWTSFRDYMNVVDRLPKAINYASNIGHSALRTHVMGERAFEQHANADDMGAMERELIDALDAGAIGFTSSLSNGHKLPEPDNRPVASYHASWEELSHLVGLVGRTGRGIFEYARERESRSKDPAVRKAVNDRLRDLAVKSGVPITFGIPFRPWGRRMRSICWTKRQQPAGACSGRRTRAASRTACRSRADCSSTTLLNGLMCVPCRSKRSAKRSKTRRRESA